MLKHLEPIVGFQEVPDEISLLFPITGCQFHCDGCHSPELREDIGIPLFDDYNKYLTEYPYVTCFCFMGGEHDQTCLIHACSIAHEHGFKTALYTPLDSFEDIDRHLLNQLDYIKLGPYVKELGGLDSPTTNQRFYRRESSDTWRQIKFYERKIPYA